jgi:hypothetical protein
MGKKTKVFLIAVVCFVAILGVSIALLVKYANRIIESELEKRLGKNFSIERIDLRWGSVEAVGVALKNRQGKEVVKVGNLLVKADFMGLLRKQYIISSVTVKDPYLFVEIDKKGNIVNPALPPELSPEQAAAKKAQEKAAAKKPPEQAMPPITIKKIEVVNGSVDYLDEKTPVRPVLLKVRDIGLVVHDVSVPFADRFSRFTMSAAIPGKLSTGTLKSDGRIKIKTKDMDLKATLRNLDVTPLKPYFEKESPVDVTKGFLDLDLTVKVASEKLHAPGTAVLKQLEFRSGPGMSAKFMGAPLSLVAAFLKNSNNEIPLNFVIEGDLNNPKFDIKENAMHRISIALAEKLGLPIKGIPEAATGIGAKAAHGVESSVKGIGQGLKKLFKGQ